MQASAIQRLRWPDQLMKMLWLTFKPAATSLHLNEQCTALLPHARSALIKVPITPTMSTCDNSGETPIREAHPLPTPPSAFWCFLRVPEFRLNFLDGRERSLEFFGKLLQVGELGNAQRLRHVAQRVLGNLAWKKTRQGALSTVLQGLLGDSRRDGLIRKSS